MSRDLDYFVRQMGKRCGGATELQARQAHFDILRERATRALEAVWRETRAKRPLAE